MVNGLSAERRIREYNYGMVFIWVQWTHPTLDYHLTKNSKKTEKVKKNNK